jgi:hypothetical protein
MNMNDIQTTTLKNGTRVLAKADGSAFTYMNDSQAALRVADLILAGIDAHCDYTRGRVVYVAID